uniref:Si:ch73-112l6.1 n=1 Tax=Nothobranchius furzeri TaxID=105023 RepID=A0A1A8A3P5_NOTFU
METLISDLIEAYSGHRGCNSLGVPLINLERMAEIWKAQKKHLSCLQDPPGVLLYMETGTIKKGGTFWKQDLSQEVLGKSCVNYTGPQAYTGELIGVEYLYDQTGDVLEDRRAATAALETEDVAVAEDEGFEESEDFVDLTVPILETTLQTPQPACSHDFLTSPASEPFLEIASVEVKHAPVDAMKETASPSRLPDFHSDDTCSRDIKETGSILEHAFLDSSRIATRLLKPFLSSSAWLTQTQREWKHIRECILNNFTIMEETTIQLPEVNKTTLTQWYCRSTQTQEKDILEQGILAPKPAISGDTSQHHSTKPFNLLHHTNHTPSSFIPTRLERQN